MDYTNYKKKDEYNSKYMFLLLLIAAITMIAGVSYAIWTILHTGNETNTIQTGCFSTTFNEGTEGINLIDTFPISDEEGLSTEPYTFTIENTCSLTAAYQVNLESLEDTDLPLSNLKISVDNDTPVLLSTIDNGSTTITNALASKIITSGKLSAGSNKTYSIRLWLDENATEESAENKTYKGKVVITTSPTR